MSDQHPTGLTDRLRSAVDVFWREAAKFGVIGALSFVIDQGGFNLLYLNGMQNKPTTATIISSVVATLFAWVGNRLWTFRHRRNRPVHHEALLFFLVNGVALGISAAYLAFTIYVLGMDSHLALNVNKFIGIAVGTLLRFYAYRQFVFAGEISDEVDTVKDPADDLRR